jgi:hypothetical protein
MLREDLNLNSKQSIESNYETRRIQAARLQHLEMTEKRRLTKKITG